MKFTLSWLKDYLDTNASLDDIVVKLTALGLEVESVTDFSKQLAAFKVAKILEATQHPQADRLRVCTVDNGTEKLQIVCGAPNARAGIKVVLAPIGTTIPGNGLVIKKSSIRSVESNGMLCSAEELGLGEESDGIIELSENDSTPLGGAAAKALGLDDAVIDVAITPNRADALGVYGIARDLAAAGLGTLKPLKAEKVAGKDASPVSVKLESPAAPYYIGRHFKGVKNGESPEWLKGRLKAIGQKPISALVDITNYITIAYGRPLHVYDVKKLSGSIIVREAKAGEKITALNDKEYAFKGGELVIADEKVAVAIAGIIGGKDTGVSETTTDVFLEVAYFDDVAIRKLGQALQIDSDAKYRFERKVDPEFVATGAELATKMIQELCGGEASELVVAGKNPYAPQSLKFDPKKVETLAGVSVSADEAKTILTKLGFGVDASFNVSVPSFRDIGGEADLVEEILRIKGYDTIPETPLPVASSFAKPALSVKQRMVSDARRILAARGLTEAVTFSFMHSEKAKAFGGIPAELKLLNPISDVLDGMRPSIIPNLMDAYVRNAARGHTNLALFEIGPVYQGIKPEQNIPMIAGLRTGLTAPKNVYKESRPLDAFDAKADALSVIALSIAPDKVQVEAGAPGYYHPGRSGTLRLGPKVIGYFGELHPALLKSWDIEDVTVAFEIFTHELPQPPKSKNKAELSPYQATTRDFAFVVDEAVTAESIIKAVRGAEKTLIKDVSLFDVYAGKGVGEGKKSVAISVVLQALDRTLTLEEIEVVAQAVIAKVAKDLNGILR